MDNNTIYKLYRDTKIKPTHDLYIKPLAGLASSATCLAVINGLSLDNNLAICASVGMATIFGLSTIKKIKFYNKVKKVYDSSYTKLNEFKEELEKVIGTEYNLNSNNIVIMPRLALEIGKDSLSVKEIVFKDSSKISEQIENGVYSCFFYKDKDLYNSRESAIDITDIAKKVLER